MSDLVITDVRKSFGSVDVLKGINLDVKSGEFIALVGPSGCGKSTLLAIIAGLKKASSGTISIRDRVVNGVAPKGPRHRHGLPVLRALSDDDGTREHDVRHGSTWRSCCRA